MEVGAREGHEFDLQEMFHRVDQPARGRRGGQAGAPTKAKGKQFVSHGRKVMMAFPGGAGYGDAAERAPSHVPRDLAHGYISEGAARAQ